MTISYSNLLIPASTSFPKLMKSKITGTIALFNDVKSGVVLQVGPRGAGYAGKTIDFYNSINIWSDWEDYNEVLTMRNV